MAGDPSGIPSRDIKILETVEDIQNRRHEVLSHYERFKHETIEKRHLLEDAMQYQQFRQNANELESWLYEKLQAASDENYARDSTNLQARIQKHHAFEAEVQARFVVLQQLDEHGGAMISRQHFASEQIKVRLDELHRLWDLLFAKLRERRIRLEEAQKLVEFMRLYEDMMFWIRDREAFLTADDSGRDLEHVEIMQRKFEDFQKDMAGQDGRVNDIVAMAKRLIQEEHPDRELIDDRRAMLLESWARLRELSLRKQEKLFGAQEIQRFNR